MPKSSYATKPALLLATPHPKCVSRSSINTHTHTHTQTQTQLNSTQLNSTQLNSTPLHSTQLNSTHVSPTSLSSAVVSMDLFHTLSKNTSLVDGDVTESHSFLAASWTFGWSGDLAMSWSWSWSWCLDRGVSNATCASISPRRSTTLNEECWVDRLSLLRLFLVHVPQ